jgi:hypothetical protein
MVIDDTVAIAAITVLGGAIAAMWVYYNKRIAAMEARIAKLETERLAEYKAHVATANKLTERCIAAIEHSATAMEELTVKVKGNK